MEKYLIPYSFKEWSALEMGVLSYDLKGVNYLSVILFLIQEPSLWNIFPNIFEGMSYCIKYSTVQYSTVQYSTVQYSAVQCSAVQCSKHSAVQYSSVL